MEPEVEKANLSRLGRKKRQLFSCVAWQKEKRKQIIVKGGATNLPLMSFAPGAKKSHKQEETFFQRKKNTRVKVYMFFMRAGRREVV